MKFEFRKTNYISEAIYTADLLGHKQANINLITPEMDDVLQLLKNASFRTFFQKLLPMKSDQSFIKSSKKQFSIKIFVPGRKRQFKETTEFIQKFIEDMKQLTS